MSKIKDKFTRGFGKKHVGTNEPVKTNVSDNDPLDGIPSSESIVEASIKVLLSTSL